MKNSSKTSKGDSGIVTVGPIGAVNCLMTTGVSCAVHAEGRVSEPAYYMGGKDKSFHIIMVVAIT